MLQNELAGLRCIHCGAATLKHNPAAEETSPLTVKNAAICDACGKGYDRVWGSLFFGDYEREDILGLVEIAANADRHGPGSCRPIEEYEKLEDLIERFHRTSDPSLFSEQEQTNPSPSIDLAYLPWRYNEWLEYQAAAGDLDLRGKKVLDVGAGIGVDSYRLWRRGADVTALEFSPVLNRMGRNSLPGLRWIGGFSHLLPFVDGCFDHVFCNAALHHMRDPGAAIMEMLRVLKPGGCLITTGDLYRPDSSSAQTDIDWLNVNPSVLQGVNETYFPLQAYVAPLKNKASCINVRLFPHLLSGPMPKLGQVYSDNLIEWPWDKIDDLSETTGCLSMRVELLAPVQHQAALQRSSVLSCFDFVAELSSQAKAVAALAPLVPEKAVTQDLRTMPAEKFQLLNGWQKPENGEGFRRAYKRARLFMRRSSEEGFLNLTLLAPGQELGYRVEFHIVLNAQIVARAHVHKGMWTPFSIDVRGADPGATFCVELRLISPGKQFQDQIFFVKDTRFSKRQESAQEQPDMTWGGLPAYMATYYGDMRDISVLVAPAQRFSVTALNALKDMGYAVKVVVPRAQRACYQALGYDVVESYAPTSLDGETAKIDTAIHVALAQDRHAFALCRKQLSAATRTLVVCAQDGTCAFGETSQFSILPIVHLPPHSRVRRFLGKVKRKLGQMVRQRI